MSAEGATAALDLATAVGALRGERLDGVTVEAVRRQVFDTLGALGAGRRLEVSGVLRDVLDGGLLDDVRWACATARAGEVDDIHIATCTTPGSVAVPVALLVGARRQAGEDAVLAGVAAGYEAMVRLGAAIDGANRVYEGAWPTLIGAPFAAAAAAGRVLGLDREALVHALAMAAARATRTSGRVAGEPSSRWPALGAAAADGVLAALCAERGMRGDPSVLAPALERIAGPADTRVFASRRPPAIGEVDVKPICTARQVLSAVEAARLAARELNGAALGHVAVHVPGQCLAMVDRPEPADRIGSIASAQFQVAAGLGWPEVLDDVGRAGPRDDEPIRALMERVTVAACPELTARYPDRWGARVELWTADGAHAEREVLEPLGSAPRPLDWDGLLDKHRRLNPHDDGVERLAETCRLLGRDGDAALRRLAEAAGRRDALR